MRSEELKEKFRVFFQERGYKNWPAASLIPDESDASVLFTTAGMHQFKRFYLEPSLAPAPRLVTCQPCLRTSDIDEVGDENHLTFFEMLGNFSFGEKNSFEMKKRAISEAWEFVTRELNIAPERITASVFGGDEGIDEDKESLVIWQEVAPGIEIKKQGREDNFWGLGRPNTPCGRATEIYVDGTEIWTLVFNEFIDNGDGSFKPLDSFGLDTGMGLERVVAVLNGESDVYQIDVLASIIRNIETVSHRSYNDSKRDFRLIADHLRAAAFLAAEGVEPSNIGQGYVLRRLLRRVVRKRIALGIQNGLLGWMAETVKSKGKQKSIERCFNNEEDIYQEPLDKVELYKTDLLVARDHGLVKKIKDVEILEAPGMASGRYVFENYQTYGVPPDLCKKVIKDVGLKLDEDGFDRAYREHQKFSRTTSVGMFKGGLADESEEAVRYHTAAHLLLAALRKVLGKHIIQKGSNITGERLRFDFSHPEKLTPEQIKKVEDWINDKIKRDLPMAREEMTMADAKESGAMGVFEERYGEKVKVYTIADPASGEIISKEICGGPHVKRTGELRQFKITKEESSSAGVRRVKAILT